LKVLQLIDSLRAGGAERMCVNIANVLHENGIDVQICVTHEGGPLEKRICPGVKCHILNKRNFIDLIAFYRLNKIIQNEKIEIIHAHSSSLFWAVASKCFLPGVKIIWHDHYGLNEENNPERRIYKIISPFSAKISTIISVNERLQKWSVENMKIAQSRVLVINNFPRLNQILHKSPSVCTTILCLANLRPQKDHSNLVRAIHFLHKKHPELKLKVKLAGIYWEDDYFTSIKQLIQGLNLYDIIHILGPVENIEHLLASADIGVLSSLSEGLPVSLLEYGLAGLPVVVTNVGKCAEVVGYGRYGKVVPPGNPEAFANELAWIIQNHTLSTQMGNDFKVNVNKNFGSEKFLIKYQELLVQI
jgi:glycosyltransferase involved in cell wall biosynthesis